MDVRPDPASSAVRPSSQMPSDRNPSREWLSELERGLAGPVVALRDALGQVQLESLGGSMAEPPGPVGTMLGLCDELLDLTGHFFRYAGLARGARPPRPVPTTIGALLGEIDRRFARDAIGRGLAWDCSIEGEDGPLTADPDLVVEVAGLLLDNALKFTPAGGFVRVSARRGGPSWSLTVADSGPGIPEEGRDRVFEPFGRLPRDERDGCAGFGLGLATCRAMAEAMGGSVDLDRDVPTGTRVVVRLPATDS